MTTLTWYGKEEVVKKAKQTPYCLLRELPDFSHNIARQPTADSRQPTADSRQPTADSRQPTADSRQPTAQLLLKPYLKSSKI
ncbi:TPA: DNA methylase N-4/N-6 [Mannheimia haemolytica]|nr:DNA methylase N-4/N-6 [Mannheimia haemolytica]HDL1127078.1 DNA methylase N-4/N-6 [Mannheimia haemolytica]